VRYTISGVVSVSCWTEVDADTEQEALAIAATRTLADVSIDGSYPIDENWHIETDGEPRNLVAEALS
jgi:hypothetical protein